MPKLRKVDASVMAEPRKRTSSGRTLSPEQQYLVNKIKSITDESVVFEVTLEPDEKPLTVRQQLLRASKAAGVEIAVRKSERGFYVGLMTPDRRSRRGRKKASPS
jgi:hypothetical protein